jgi:hypothetical protein
MYHHPPPLKQYQLKPCLEVIAAAAAAALRDMRPPLPISTNYLVVGHWVVTNKAAPQ